jgi:isoleucyl-tRNA synthetase
VFFHTWHAVPRPADAEALIEKWERLRELRDPVRKEIEALRADGKIGSSLQAEVDYPVVGRDYDFLSSLANELKFLLITSRAVARRGEGTVAVKPSEHPKCERCWHYTPDVNAEGLCARCQANLTGEGETRRYV